MGRKNRENNGRRTRDDWSRLRAKQDYAEIFGSFELGFTVNIERVQPTWCDGWCETISFDPEEPLNLEYIRDTWGGRRFKLEVRDQFGKYVTSFRISIDSPPRRFGRLIESPDEVDRRQRREDRELELRRLDRQPQQQPAPAPAPVIDPTIGKILADSIAGSRNANSGELKFLRELAEKQLSREPQAKSDLKEMMELAKGMREMADMFGLAAPGDAGDDIWGNNASKLLDLLGKKSELDELRARRRKPANAHKANSPKIRIVKNLGPAPSMGSAGDQQDHPRELSRAQLAATLAGMNAMDAASVVMATLAKMPADTREELTSILMGEEIEEEEIEEIEEEERDTTGMFGDDDPKHDERAS
jgi:hypothetical protein